MNSHKKNKYLLLLFLIIPFSVTFSQGIMISDDGDTVADPSAVLEIQSNSKGLLIPRLTTLQRNSLASFAKEGLLVYDSDLGSFFIFGKTSTGEVDWNDLSTPSGIWKTNSNDVYLASPYSNVGIGTSSPSKKLVIKAQNDNDTLFEILDKDDKPLMIITPSLTKIYFNQPSKGVAGGFAVGRYAAAKATNDTAVFLVTRDSTRVYTSATTTKGVAGGFAVGRYAPAKGGAANKYFFTGIDSTRVYTDGNNKKGVAGGFAVGRYAAAKGNDNYMYMIPDNYFIGHNSGAALQNTTNTGLYNTFFGYQTGSNATGGSSNVFIGYESGLNNTNGDNNVFVGFKTGYTNTYGFNNVYIGNSVAGEGNGSQNVIIGDSAGYSNITSQNVFVGEQSGHNNTTGSRNVFLGFWSGASNLTGTQNTYLGGFAGNDNLSQYNTFVGYWAGGSNVDGENNVFIGRRAGQGTSGSNNVFLGSSAGEYAFGSNRLYIANASGTPLIYGEFDNRRVGINASNPTANFHIKQVGSSEEAFAIENDSNTNTWSWEVGTNDLLLYFNGAYVGYWDDATGNYNATSDKRLKKDIEYLNDNILERVMKLKPATYRLKHADKSGNKNIGFIAQEVQEYFPEIVYHEDENNFLSLHYSDFGVIAIKAIQEQQEQIIKQQKEIESLKSLKSKVDKLERQLKQLKEVIKQK